MRPEAVRVVIPTYNERETILHVIAAIRLQGYGILIVDDGSPDGTADLVGEVRRDDVAVELLQRTSKDGLGRAYAAGFAQALAHQPDVIVQMDADLSHNPSDIPRLVKAVEAGADVAIGSRYVPGGGTPDWPVHRRLISRGGNIYARLMLGLSVHDATAGFRAFRASSLGSLPFASAQSSGYAFQIEMALRAVEAGMQVIEVPIEFRDRELGVSKMTSDIVSEAMKLVTRWGLEKRGVIRSRPSSPIQSASDKNR